ncbi:hypothetical protein F4780DRAFT_779393 [Xylariomycetidae sp. FL0641]|nr:hypothetical protein F4780DRAFT_779393 [Xylariomycetidae sp. FL0641]
MPDLREHLLTGPVLSADAIAAGKRPKKPAKRPTRAPAGSGGGGGEDLPPFALNLRAGHSHIGGNGMRLPAIIIGGSPPPPLGAKPGLMTMEPAVTTTTAQATGSLGANNGTTTDPREFKPILENAEAADASKKTPWF